MFITTSNKSIYEPSSTMRSFGTAMNNNFGEVEETGILISIKDIYPEKKRQTHRFVS